MYITMNHNRNTRGQLERKELDFFQMSVSTIGIKFSERHNSFYDVS